MDEATGMQLIWKYLFTWSMAGVEQVSPAQMLDPQAQAPFRQQARRGIVLDQHGDPHSPFLQFRRDFRKSRFPSPRRFKFARTAKPADFPPE